MGVTAPYPDHLAALVVWCAGQDEFVAQWERLSGKSLADTRTPIEKMVDEACGLKVLSDAQKEFAEFVYDTVWCRLSRECFEEANP